LGIIDQVANRDRSERRPGSARRWAIIDVCPAASGACRGRDPSTVSRA